MAHDSDSEALGYPTEEKIKYAKERGRKNKDGKHYKWTKHRDQFCSAGLGPGKPLICDLCKKRVSRIKITIKKGVSIAHCKHCKHCKPLK